MKVVSAKEMQHIESLAFRTYGNDQAKEFMEQAGKGIAQCVENYFHEHKLQKHLSSILLLCAKGNNSGDAYVAGRFLLQAGYLVEALQIFPITDCSALCRENYQLFANKNGKVHYYTDPSGCKFSKYSLLLDGLLGTGLKGEVSSLLKEVIFAVNDSSIPVLSIDIPSGLSGDEGFQQEGDLPLERTPVIKAQETVFLGLPKRGYFLRNSWEYVGTITGVDFGLQEEFLAKAHEDFTLLTKAKVLALLPKVKRTRHKYERGQVIGLAGSKGMTGAAYLASLACYRSGAGIVKLCCPENIAQEVVNFPPELIKIFYDQNEDKLEGIVLHLNEAFNKANAAFIGCGLGISSFSKKLLHKLLPTLQIPVVLDADALTLFAQKPFTLPGKVIFTPHMGELMRLMGWSKKPMVDLQFLEMCLKYTQKNHVTLIVKGAPTFIVSWLSQSIYICDRGHPGMATAGSGDCLSGILAAFLSQGLNPLEASLVGVYLHSICGEIAGKEYTSFSMLASDMIAALPAAFKGLKGCC